MAIGPTRSHKGDMTDDLYKSHLNQLRAKTKQPVSDVPAASDPAASDPAASDPAASEMSALIRAKDWSKTVLGSTNRWSPSLTLVVNTILASGFPMAVRWGPDFVMIYNDARS